MQFSLEKATFLTPGLCIASQFIVSQKWVVVKPSCGSRGPCSCVYIYIPHLGQTFFRAFIRRGEKSWIRFSSLWLSTQYCSTPSPSPFPLSGCRTLKLQKPFVPGPLRGEATLCICTDLPDPLLEQWGIQCFLGCSLLVMYCHSK